MKSRCCVAFLLALVLVSNAVMADTCATTFSAIAGDPELNRIVPQCEVNTMKFLKDLEGKEDLSKLRVLVIFRYPHTSFELVSARSNPFRKQAKNRTEYHVVAIRKSDGMVYDADFTDHPEPIPLRDYVKRQLGSLDDVKPTEQGPSSQLYVGELSAEDYVKDKTIGAMNLRIRNQTIDRAMTRSLPNAKFMPLVDYLRQSP